MCKKNSHIKKGTVIFPQHHEFRILTNIILKVNDTRQFLFLDYLKVMLI